MELDMTGAPVVVFRHAGHGRVNVVYRRSDGHVGWIDPPVGRDRGSPLTRWRPFLWSAALRIRRPAAIKSRHRFPGKFHAAQRSRRAECDHSGAQGQQQEAGAAGACRARRASSRGQNERAIFEILMQREKLGSTAVGNGIAIPHGKLPKLDKAVRSVRAARPADRFRSARRSAGRSDLPAAGARRRRRRSSQGAGARRAIAARSVDRAQAARLARRRGALRRAGDAVRQRGVSNQIVIPVRRKRRIDRTSRLRAASHCAVADSGLAGCRPRPE